MLNYLLEFSIYWLIFLGLYQLTFSKLTTLNMNRWYLWSSLAISLVIPGLPQWSRSTVVSMPQVELPAVWIGSQSASSPVTPEQLPFSFWSLLFSSVALILLARMISGLYELWKLNRGTTLNYWNGYAIRQSATIKEPFSFLNSVYLPSDHNFTKEELNHILQHETGHLHHGHTWDNLTMELLLSVLWWNPMFYFFRRSIKEIHEYQADAFIARSGQWQSYGHFLLAHGVSFSHIPLVQTIFSHPLKKRIKMMKIMQNQPKRYTRYLAILPILGLCLFFHACADKEPVEEAMETPVDQGSEELTQTVTFIDTIIAFDPETKTEEMKIVERTENVYTDIDQKPRFPGCEEDGLVGDDLYNCSVKKFLEWIYENVEYPTEAKDAGKEGMAVVTFVVTKDGYITRPEIVKDPGFGMGEAALNTLKKLEQEDITWLPGEKDGEQVNFQFTLPLKFKLN